MRAPPDIIPLRAASHFPSLSHREDIESNWHMFSEDVRTGIAPYRARPSFRCVFEGKEEDVLAAKSILGLLSRYSANEKEEDIVCDALREICGLLVWNGGVANYEIMREIGTLKPVRLSSFTNKRLAVTPWGYFQIVPRKDYEALNKKIIFIPKHFVWRIKIPAELSGQRGFQKMVSALGRFNYMGPRFFMADLQKQKANFSRTFSDYAEICRTYQSKSTGDWRWNFRGLFEKNSTEFYSLLRRVEFEISLAVLREHLIKEINRLYLDLRLDCILKMEGLLTADQLRKVRVDFLTNDIPFEEIYKRTSINA